MKRSERVKLLAVCGGLFLAGVAFGVEVPCLVPAPRAMTVGDGELTLTNGDVFAQVSYAHDDSIAAEGYRLTVDARGIRVVSSDAAGAFYARKTLEQLLSSEKGACRLPYVEIDDAPAFRWRGVHMDDCRHFFGKWTVKRVIDQISRHKFNVFHWHLTDDQGWRLDIPGYPDLLKYAAVRPSSYEPDSDRQDGLRYGPFYYTEADLKEVIAYAAERHVTVVPEIELPGHFAAALAAYPEFACQPENLADRCPRLHWGVSDEVLCLGNDRGIKFLEDVIDYVCRVFPGPYVHIGGDECPRTRWKTCPKCQRRITDENLGGVDGLQPWITRRFVKFLADRGKRAIGWDEYLNGDVPSSAVGMSWRTPGQGAKDVKLVSSADVAAKGHDLVIATHEFVYLNYSSGAEDNPYYGRTWSKISLEKAYSYNPYLGIPENLRGRILGGQCCNWAENTYNFYDLAWKMWPRACAIAEVLWLGDAKPGYWDFLRRMRRHRPRLVKDYVNCAPLPDVSRVPEARTGAAIQKAIDEMAAVGGGVVRLEPAVYPSGTLYLKSNVELNIPAGATILGGTNPDDYDDVDDPRLGKSPESSKKVFIACIDGENVAITGEGTVDGRGVGFYTAGMHSNGRFFNKPPHPRPRMVQFFRCRNVRFEGVEFKDSPGWTFWIRECEDVAISRLRIHGDQRMINNDGLHIDGCRRVRISDCDIRTGDDCIIMRANRTKGTDLVCEDMVVTDCSLNSACQCIRLSCPADDTIRRGRFLRLKMSGNNGIHSAHPRRYLPVWSEGYAKMEDIVFEDCDIDVSGSAIGFWVEPGVRLRDFGNTTFRNMRIKSGKPLLLQGTADAPLHNLRFENVRGTVESIEPIVMKAVENVTFDGCSFISEKGASVPLVRGDSGSWESAR